VIASKMSPADRLYLWIDADTWVQEWSAVKMMLATAERGARAICPAIDRCYKRPKLCTAPMWDAAARRFVERNALHQPLCILYLAGERPKTKTFAAETLDGGRLSTMLCYRASAPDAAVARGEARRQG
jgi:hypothetical protein